LILSEDIQHLPGLSPLLLACAGRSLSLAQAFLLAELMLPFRILSGEEKTWW